MTRSTPLVNPPREAAVTPPPDEERDHTAPVSQFPEATEYQVRALERGEKAAEQKQSKHKNLIEKLI
jgi:hypothetical protein